MLSIQQQQVFRNSRSESRVTPRLFWTRSFWRGIRRQPAHNSPITPKRKSTAKTSRQSSSTKSSQARSAPTSFLPMAAGKLAPSIFPAISSVSKPRAAIS